MFKWGVIGTGVISVKFSNCLKAVEDTCIVGAYDLFKESAQRFAGERPGVKVYDSIEDMLANPEIDGIYIATTNPSHYEIAKACILAGKPAYCEKPFVLEKEQAKELVALSEKCGVFLCENLWTKYLPIYDQLRVLVASGEIGEVRFISCDYFFPGEYDPNSRLFDPEKGGGALYDIGTYGLGFIGMFFGYTPTKVVSIAGLCPTGVDDRLHLAMRFGDKIADVTCSDTTPAPQKAVLIGTKGRIEIPEFGRAQHCHVWVYGDGRTDANSKGAGTRSSVPEGGHDYEIECPFKENGFEYIVSAVINSIKEGKVELERASHREMIAWVGIKEDIVNEYKAEK